MDKKKRKESYESPKMEIMDIMVEQAILQGSFDFYGDPFEDGWNDEEVL